MRISPFLFLICFTATLLGQIPHTRPVQSPKLVVGVVIDQMRYEYLMRYWSKFEDGGFKRILNGGVNCENTHYNYVPTYTGPGHAAIYTGTTPCINGIVANDWYSRTEKKVVYCAEDTSVSAVSGAKMAGTMSPKRLKSNTFTDELRLSSRFQSKVIGISIKDRGAILPAGHKPNGAYWFDGKSTGNFMSSTYYFPQGELPQWVKNFNAKGLAQQYLSQKWTTLYPIEQYTESDIDDSPYEGKLKSEKSPTFPHDLPSISTNMGVGLLPFTPFGNSIVKEFAIAAIEGEELGKDNIPDVLAISFSASDYIGHLYGTYAIETEDMYLRLDKEIASLLRYLDKNIGKGKYLMFITADHGAVDVPQFLMDNRFPSGRWSPDSVKKAINTFSQNTWGDSLVIAVMNDMVYFDYEKIKAKKLDLAQVEKQVAEFSLTIHGVTATLTGTQLRTESYTDIIRNKIQAGFKAKESGDVRLIWEPGWLDYGLTGTSHGSPYQYDTHIPLLWYGWKLKHKTLTQALHITDIAPTLSIILNIPFPNGCSGQPIQDMFMD